MKKIIFGLLLLVFSVSCFADCGIFKAYIILDVNNTGTQYYGGANYGDGNPEFNGYDFGSPTSLTLKGAEVNTFKNGSSDVFSTYLNYEVYKDGEEQNVYSGFSLPFDQDLGNGDQRWAETNTSIDLLALMTSAGTWNIEVYWSAVTNEGDKYYNDNGNNYIATLTVTILPVELTQFSARANDESVTIDWSTLSESNSDYFRVERSLDGRNFGAIGEVKAQGNSVEKINYSFRDEDPVQGINYYRLRQVDLDGSFLFSEISPVDYRSDNNQFDMYPVPANGEISFASTIPCKLIIYNPSGQIVHEQTCNADENTIDLYSLTPGLYFYTVYKATDFSEIGKGKIILE